ncbi:hypothetical protein [Paenibacillus typhae]|uniref:hypothetical protein n=1 Tax=Paenibacillus typhae TaxID=1174501 RepID=UPI001C8D1F89|nr:hypothetical protein [Paenibacillus typhae]MBY0014022.1 hypothetical protein [Paenibacillus typhae]
MKLRGTLTEQSFRKELQASKKHLFNDVSMRRFLNTLKQTCPAMKTAYTLYWIPEQGEDIITFLVDMDYVVTIELDRYNHTIAPIVSVDPIESLHTGLSKINQIKIVVALDLAKKDLER